MRVAQKMRWNKILLKVKKVSGNTPQSEHCVKNTTQRVTAAGKKGAAKTNYKNCGRKKALTPEASKKLFIFVKTWKKKASCTCPMHRPRAAFRQLIPQWPASGIYSSRRPSCHGVVGPDPAIDDAAFGWRMLATPADDPSEVVNLYYFTG